MTYLTGFGLTTYQGAITGYVWDTSQSRYNLSKFGELDYWGSAWARPTYPTLHPSIPGNINPVIGPPITNIGWGPGLVPPPAGYTGPTQGTPPPSTPIETMRSGAGVYYLLPFGLFRRLHSLRDRFISKKRHKQLHPVI